MKELKRERWKRTIWMWIAIGTLFLLIGFFLWQFNEDMKNAEYMRNREKMLGVADKAALAVDNKLNSTISILETVAGYINPEKTVQNPKSMAYLKKLAKDNGMDRIGIMDLKGNVVATNGKSANVLNQEFFQKSLKGECFISSVFPTETSPEKSIGVSVPIKSEDEQIHGVLYGVILVKDLNLNKEFEDEENDGTLVHIVDADGNYIAKGKQGNYACEGKENIFDALKESGIEREEAKELLEGEESKFRRIVRDGELRLMCFSPMKEKDWCVVTVLTGEAANVNINYSQKIVLMLITKILLAIAALIAIGYYVVTKEKVCIKKLNQELLLKDEIFRIAATEAKSFVFIYNVDTKRIEFMNYKESYKRLFDRTIENFPENIPTFIPRNSMAYSEIQKMIGELEAGRKTVEGELSFDLRGTIIHYNVTVTRARENNKEGRLCIGSLIDVTDEKQNAIFLQSQVGKDPLTKVYNRLAAVEQINKILQNRRELTCAFLIIDLDNFKAVNDSLGHLTGDKALVDVANIIQKHVRQRDIVCRLGGDEFVVFLVDIPVDVIRRNVEALLRKLHLTYEFDGKKESFSASAGITVTPKDGCEFKELYEKADKALYQIKKNGKNGYAFYEEETDEER